MDQGRCHVCQYPTPCQRPRPGGPSPDSPWNCASRAASSWPSESPACWSPRRSAIAPVRLIVPFAVAFVAVGAFSLRNSRWLRAAPRPAAADGVRIEERSHDRAARPGVPGPPADRRGRGGGAGARPRRGDGRHRRGRRGRGHPQLPLGARAASAPRATRSSASSAPRRSPAASAPSTPGPCRTARCSRRRWCRRRGRAASATRGPGSSRRWPCAVSPE